MLPFRVPLIRWVRVSGRVNFLVEIYCERIGEEVCVLVKEITELQGVEGGSLSAGWLKYCPNVISVIEGGR